MKSERDEYLLHPTPVHKFPQYTTAHAMAGDLKLDEPVQTNGAADPGSVSVDVLARLARNPKK